MRQRESETERQRETERDRQRERQTEKGGRKTIKDIMRDHINS